jgi:hypothetical protein
VRVPLIWATMLAANGLLARCGTDPAPTKLVLLAGGSLREVMNRLGHSTTVAAVRYQHAMVDRDAAIARELDRLMRGIFKRP